MKNNFKDIEINFRDFLENSNKEISSFVLKENPLPLSFNNSFNELTRKLCTDLHSQLEDAIIEGLKRKGYEFETKFELEQFAKDRCRCEDNVHFQERVYYVDDTPFFLHNYKVVFDIKTINKERCTKMYAENGSFVYL